MDNMQELKKRIKQNEYLSWFVKELEQMLEIREKTIEKVIAILRENHIEEDKIKSALIKYYSLEPAEAKEKMAVDESDLPEWWCMVWNDKRIK